MKGQTVVLATSADVQGALLAMGRDDLAEPLQDVADLLLEASDLVEGYLWPSTPPEPTPPAISRVVATMVATALTRPKGLLPETTTLSADGFGVGFTPGTTSPGPYLTLALKARLRPYKATAGSTEQRSERF